MLQETIRKFVNSQDICLEEACETFKEALKEEKKENIAALLLTLQEKGFTEQEFAGFALGIKSVLQPVKNLRPGAVNIATLDLKNNNTFSVDLATAFVVAGCGIPVASNYLNPSHTLSKTAKALKDLGINLKITPSQAEKCFNDIGIVFVDLLSFIPNNEVLDNALFGIKTETIFDIIASIYSPFDVKFSFIGGGQNLNTDIICKAFKYLELKRCLLVRGEDNIDAITTCEPSKICDYNKGEISTYFLNPQDFGLEKNTRSDLICDQDKNAEIIKSILSGKGENYTNIVLVNAAAALLTCGSVNSWKDGIEKAKKSLKQGRALSKFKNIQNWTNNCKN